MFDDYGVGYASNTNTKFYFDIEDFDNVNKYTWRKNERGYITTTINNYDGFGHNKNLFLHQLVMDTHNAEVIDHKDRDKSNCRKSNLHITTQQQNIINRGVQKNNTSGYTGIYINKSIKNR